MNSGTTSSTVGTVCSGASCTATMAPAPKELTIEDFVFRNPIDPLPKGSESNRRTQYATKPEWGSEILDRRLREKVVVTFKAIKTDNDVKYKLYLVKDDNSDVVVSSDSSNSVSKFTFYSDDEFHTMTNAEGLHYWELWKLKYKGVQKIDLIPEGKYKCKMITRDKNNKKKTWYSKNTIEIKYDPFKVTIICAPMSNPEIEAESKEENRSGHYIAKNGRRIDKDCYLKVYRGKHPESVEVGEFKALMMPTGISGQPIATPAGTYFGYKDLHNSVYACVEMESTKGTTGDGKVELPQGCINPATQGNYKKQVQIHKNPNEKSKGWTSPGLSTGCIVVPSKVPEDQFGKFGDPIKNSQNKIDKNSLMGSIFGGYDDEVIPDVRNHNKKLDIQVVLKKDDGDQYGTYRRIHEDIIQELTVTPNKEKFDISFRVPIGIFRNYRGARRHFAVAGHTTFRWYIAQRNVDGKIVPVRTIKGPSFMQLNPGEHTWPWDGYDKKQGVAGRKRETGTYLCIIETKFNNGLPGQDEIKEDKVLNPDGTLGDVWNQTIIIPPPIV